MALVFSGKSKCALCDQILDVDDEIVGFPAFLPETHSLWRYSDAAFHEDCYQSWEHGERFEALYKTFRKIWDSRPKDLQSAEEMTAWGREAFKDFPGDEDHKPNTNVS